MVNAVLGLKNPSRGGASAAGSSTLRTYEVGEAYGHVQGESLKPYAALHVRLLNSPITRGERWGSLVQFAVAKTRKRCRSFMSPEHLRPIQVHLALASPVITKQSASQTQAPTHSRTSPSGVRHLRREALLSKGFGRCWGSYPRSASQQYSIQTLWGLLCGPCYLRHYSLPPAAQRATTAIFIRDAMMLGPRECFVCDATTCFLLRRQRAERSSRKIRYYR